MAVIAGGLMLGTVFSMSLPAQGGKQSNFLQNLPGKSSSTNSFDAQLTANPLIIDSVGESSDLKGLTTKQQSLLTITYTNNTNSDLTNVEIWASGTGANFGFYGSKDAIYDKDTKVANIKYSIFKARDLKKGQSGTAFLYLFSRQPGVIKVNIDAKAKGGENSKTTSVSITAN